MKEIDRLKMLVLLFKAHLGRLHFESLISTRA